MSAGPLTVGWHLIDSGPAPRSAMLDTPPTAAGPQLLAAHHQWRTSVEADERRLATAHAQRPVWFPVQMRTAGGVLPVFGGTPATWNMLITILAASAAATRYSRIRVVNLTAHNVFEGLRESARATGGFAVRCDTVSGTGSSLDLFSRLSAHHLAAVIVDACRNVTGRAGAVDAIRAVEDLHEVLALLSGPATLPRLRAAIDVALGNRTHASTQLSVKEQRALSDYHADVVSARQPIADRLTDRHRDISGLMRFQQSSAITAERLGRSSRTVRTFEVGAGTGTQDIELGRALLAASIARGFDEPVPGDDLLVIAGADRLPAEVLDRLTAAGHQPGKRLILLCAKIEDQTQRLLGHAGSAAVVFLRLPHQDYARLAAEYLGREFTFVVNGVSIAEGNTASWSTADSQMSSVSRSRGRNSTRHMFRFAHDFGRQVSTSLTTGSSTTTTHGGSTQRTTTTSLGRVHDYVVQPEVFQRLEERCMLVVDRHTVTLISCDPRIAGSPLTSSQPLPRTP